MADKSSGFEFDRQAFVHPDPPRARPATPIVGILFALIAVAAIGYLAYKLFPQGAADASNATGVAKADDQSLAEINNRLSDIETRLDRLEAVRRAGATRRGEQRDPRQPASAATRSSARRAFAASAKPGQFAPPAQSGGDAATAQKLAAVQNGVTTLRNEQTRDREAWQAATDRMAEMAGEVGNQSVQVLRNQDELNEVLADTEMEAIPFELYRGANPQPVGPVSLALKSVSLKHQSYTLCVYIQSSCTELKNRILHEVVQFVTARNRAPLKVIGTKISDDEMVGYLEVPRSQTSH